MIILILKINDDNDEMTINDVTNEMMTMIMAVIVMPMCINETMIMTMWQ